MKKIVSVLFVLGVLLIGSFVVFADPGTAPGTETIKTIVTTPNGK